MDFIGIVFFCSDSQESILGSKMKRLQKKNKNVDIDQILNSIPTPSLWNLLPFQIVRGVWNAPKTIKETYHEWADYKKIQEEEKQRWVELIWVTLVCHVLIEFACFDRELEEQEQQRLAEEEFIKQKEARKEGLRKRKPVFTAQEKSAEELKGYSQLNMDALAGDGVRAVDSKVSCNISMS